VELEAQILTIDNNLRHKIDGWIFFPISVREEEKLKIYKSVYLLQKNIDP